MDIDGDVDGSLSQALSCMATNDRETLIKRFQQVLGDNYTPSPEACAFFLDMNSWNLQAALGAYYDYGSNYSLGSPPPEYVTNLPEMQFIRDVTIGEGESVPPSTRFIKTWRLRNCGREPWPVGCYISYMEGEKLSEVNRSYVVPLDPGEEGDISVEMISPSTKGIYQSRWQLNTGSGIPFGESIWCIIGVDDLGILGITQQLASAPLGSPSHNGHSLNASNPFATSLPFHCLSGNNEFENGQRQNHFPGDSMDEDTTIESDPNHNQNTMLYNAVINKLPKDSDTSGNHHAVVISDPINIAELDQAPDVPPCTPCTPPQ